MRPGGSARGRSAALVRSSRCFAGARRNDMAEASNDKQQIIDAYRRRAPNYDLVVRLFDIFAWFGFNIAGWRKHAIRELGLKAGDTAVEIGWGTGLHFPLLYHE